MTSIQKQQAITPGVGVFGCNRKNEYLVNCLIKNGFKVTAIWSDCLKEAREFANRFLIDFYTDKVDVLLLKKEVELILINCHQSHYVQIVTKAFRIGKHVLCDWPSNLTANELNKMHEAASYYPSLISIYSFPLRFLPQFKLMRNLIQEQNYIGDITLINVNINGRTLIELDNIEQLINQSNCVYCNGSEKLIEGETSSDEPGSFERTDESSIEDQFVDPNKVIDERNKLNNHKSVQESTNHQTHPTTNGLKANEKAKSLKSTINLIKRLAISSEENKKYKNVMQEGGILSSLGPHVIDIISFVTNLKVKKCNGILRTFNISPFPSELSLIKRINVDDFCTFQLQMDKSSVLSSTNRTSNNKSIDEKTCNNKSPSNNQTTLKSNIKVKELANNRPIAVVTLNDHVETFNKSYEIVVAGEFGYLRLKDGNLFGRQYEQNNNDGSANSESLGEEKAFYLVKNNLRFDNFCIKHQDLELSKLILNNKQLFRPFKSGLENMIESVKSAFDNETILRTVTKNSDKKSINGLDKNGIKQNGNTGLLNSIKENRQQGQINGDNGQSMITQINNERNLQPLKLIQNNKPVDKLIINSSNKMAIKSNGQTNNQTNGHSDKKLNSLTNSHRKSQQINGHSTNRQTNGEQIDNQLTNIRQTNGINKLITDENQMNGIKKDSLPNGQVNNIQQNGQTNQLHDQSSDKAVETHKDISKVDEPVKRVDVSSEKCCNKLQRIKEAICMASSFEDGRYVQSVIEAIRLSSNRCEWIRPQLCFVKPKQ